jgi:hypothetical protein
MKTSFWLGLDLPAARIALSIRLFDHQHRRLIRVVVTDAEQAQRPLGGQVNLVALVPAKRRTPEGGRIRR